MAAVSAPLVRVFARNRYFYPFIIRNTQVRVPILHPLVERHNLCDHDRCCCCCCTLIRSTYVSRVDRAIYTVPSYCMRQARTTTSAWSAHVSDIRSCRHPRMSATQIDWSKERKLRRTRTQGTERVITPLEPQPRFGDKPVKL